MKKIIERVSVENGKYEYLLYDDYSSAVLRHGEAWRDTTGDKFIGLLISEIRELQTKIAEG